MEQLVHVQRPRLAALSDTELRAELRTIDQRILTLEESLRMAVVVPPPPTADGPIRFGATVTVRDRSGHNDSYRIVGVYEADADRGWVSFLSPIARALLNKQLGDRTRLRLPAGEEELEIVGVAYD
jgi:transcription elongation factor GreB